MSDTDVLLDVKDLTVDFPVRRSSLLPRKPVVLKAVDRVSFQIRRGETLGLVGESGSGKTTIGRAILRIVEPTAGEVRFDGVDLAGLTQRQMRPLRKHLQMVFQDPYASLDPRARVRTIVAEPLQIHGVSRGNERKRRVAELLTMVGLDPSFANRYPHEFSGGQRQRIGIARALAVTPKFIVCDEPVSALDVSIQAQVINLLEELRDRLGLTYLFIAHDVAVVRHISNRIAVMYLGKIVEVGDSEEVSTRPLHPYTQALISAVPHPDPETEAARRPVELTGEMPSPVNPPSGCHFHTRCPIATSICSQTEPAFEPKLPGHWVACHHVEATATAAQAPSRA